MNYTFRTESKKVPGDLHTPVSIYLKVRDIYPKSALLESADFHGNENSLSYIALCPLASIGINGGESVASFPDGKTERTALTAEGYGVADTLNAFLGRFRVEGGDRDVCGLFGYTAFDAVRYLEPVSVMEVHHDENDAPDMLYILYRYILVFDHFKNELTLIELLREAEESRLQEIETLIENRNYASYNFTAVGQETSTVTGEEYKAMVRQGIRHCLRGDVFQIVLSRRFEQAFKGDDFKVYRALRSINPSPYLFYFDFGGFRIFGSSPETHCKVTNGHATIDPIAGTAFRTGHDALDRQRTEALLADPKENAEHVMLVDLARNDLSRNARDVKVDFYKEVQYYSHVIHLVSRVSGDIHAGSNPVKTYIDTFPAGTLSGAPQVRAMQLITAIEKHNRG
ncbi:MAG: anthranilate synthase component I family protein, partial [Tannerellaceae bacterium]|nr:anthranilate synthase component I family protein [Tannerellaceae bacterium]